MARRPPPPGSLGLRPTSDDYHQMTTAPPTACGAYGTWCMRLQMKMGVGMGLSLAMPAHRRQIERHQRRLKRRRRRQRQRQKGGCRRLSPAVRRPLIVPNAQHVHHWEPRFDDERGCTHGQLREPDKAQVRGTPCRSCMRKLNVSHPPLPPLLPVLAPADRSVEHGMGTRSRVIVRSTGWRRSGVER